MNIAGATGWFAETSDGQFIPLAIWQADINDYIKGVVMMGDMACLASELDDFVGYVHESELMTIDERDELTD